MTATTGFTDHAIVRQVIDLYEGMRHDPIASRLASIEFGSISLWSAFQYEFADLLYDHVWGRTHPGIRQASDAEASGEDGLAGQLKDHLWRGTWGQESLFRLLEHIGALDLLEGAQFVWRSHLKRAVSPAAIALVGFAHRSGLMRFPPFANDRASHHGASFHILLHDDNAGRQRRAYQPVKHRLIACESYLEARDYREATQRAREVQAILAPGETRGVPLSDVFRRFKSKSVNRRRFRRLCLGAEALGRFMTSGDVKTYVVPDERQPLARAAAATAKACSSARVVCVPEPVDQFVRKMPYWGEIHSDVVVAACATIQRALTRSGVSSEKFKTCSVPGLRSFLDSVAAPPHPPEIRGTPQPTILYCDQGLSGTARRVTQLVDCLGNPPRATLIFRPHPVQSTVLMRLVVEGGTVTRSQSVIEAIRSCDLVVTHSSMMANVAALMERPVILWNPAPSPTMPVLVFANVAYWARTHDELADLITLCLRSRPDHPLREHQAAFRRELASSCSEEGLDSLL